MNYKDKLIPHTDEKRPFVDETRRNFLVAAGLLGGIGTLLSLYPFISSWQPTAKTLATGGPIEVDLRRLEPDQMMIIEWQGKPVWVIRRSAAMLRGIENSDNSKLRDPLSLVEQQPTYAKNQYRSRLPEYLVVVGLCTHLGCSPKYKPSLDELNSDWPGGFICPCHGSTFDLSGRVFKNVPAPINLAVPPHRFLNKHTLLIGEE